MSAMAMLRQSFLRPGNPFTTAISVVYQFEIQLIHDRNFLQLDKPPPANIILRKF